MELNTVPHPFFDEDVQVCDNIWAMDETSGTEMLCVECIVAGVQHIPQNDTFIVTFIPRDFAYMLIDEGTPIAQYCYRSNVYIGEVLTFVPGMYSTYTVNNQPRVVKLREVTGDFKAKSTRAMLEARIDAYSDPAIAAMALYTTGGIKTRSKYYPIKTS